MPERLYLDWNATTPLRPEARRAMVEAMELTGNPSSVHAEGRAARQRVEEARQTLAQAVGVESGEVIFTSGGTEANALALHPAWRSARGAPPLARLIVSAIEHPSVLAGGRFAQEQIAVAPVTADGVLDLEVLRALVASGPPALVALMLANNETGVIQPVREAAAIAHEAGGLLHVDAVQALGKIPVDARALGADLIAVSAHKLGGPKGVGALILANPQLEGLAPLIRGGGQERHRRSGTENVVGIAGFGAAVAVAVAGLGREERRLAALQALLEGALTSHHDTVIFGRNVPRLPNTTFFAVPGVAAETALIALDLDGVAVSSGSACSSGKVQLSHVLGAMGVPARVGQGALRLSTGFGTTERDIERYLEAWRMRVGVLGNQGRNSA